MNSPTEDVATTATTATKTTTVTNDDDSSLEAANAARAQGNTQLAQQLFTTLAETESTSNTVIYNFLKKRRKEKKKKKLCSLSLKVKAKAFYALGEMHEWREVTGGDNDNNNAMVTTHDINNVDEDESLLRATHHYSRAASLGHAPAHAALGLIFSIRSNALPTTSPESRQLDARALLHYTAAGTQSTAADMALGYRFLFGRGVPMSCPRAAVHYERAARVVIDEIVRSGLHPNSRAARVALSDSDLPPPAAGDEDSARRRDADESTDVIEYFQYKSSSDRSDASALLTLGLLYLQGTPVVKRDFSRALVYFRDAAKLDAPASALAMLGFMHDHGYGVVRDRHRAIELWQEAIDADADNIYATSFLGVRRARAGDFAAAHDLLKGAAARGSPAAQIELGHLYYEGAGVARHYTTALHLYTQASKAGFLEAHFMLAKMHLQGHGTQRSCTTAVQLLKKVAERGLRRDLLEPPHTCHRFGDERCAVHGYELAAEYGLEVAQSNAAGLLLERQARMQAAGASEAAVAKVARRARVRLVDAAEQSSAIAHRLLGDLYASGHGIDAGVSNERAVAFYQAASARRDPEATFALGYMHQHGLGVPIDAHLAKRYYDLAAQLDPRASAASMFALVLLGAQYGYSHLQLMVSPEYDGIDWGAGHEYRANWDTILIAVLTLLLLLVLCVRRVCL
jgi:SEL1 protein